ncbi:MAG: iron-containing alcohol dehydrogenase [Oscillospiraceae bacterium]|nr:iron-containing alcohol dehydrogenase [Oscillospiraceae bacterium]
MENFTHYIPTELRFGKGVTERLPEVLSRFGKNILLVYGGGSIKHNGIYDRITSQLSDNGFTLFECAGVEPNPRVSTVERGAAICKNNLIDAVLAVGGGSVIDCAKAIATAAFNDDDAWDMVLHSKPGRKSLPVITVLTMSATGSEFDNKGVISNPETKEKYSSVFSYPVVSFCDPTLTYSVPPYQTACGSADILSHAMEAYFSRTDTSEISDGIAETLMRAVIHNLPIALKEPDNYDARANLMWASSIACSGIPDYGKIYPGKTCHAIGHEFSAVYDSTHGEVLAILTPRWMRFILTKDPSVTSRFTRFARRVWDLTGEDGSGLAFHGIECLEQFLGGIGIATSFSQLGIDDRHFTEIARHADLRGRCSNSFVPLSENDVIEILRNCL